MNLNLQFLSHQAMVTALLIRLEATSKFKCVLNFADGSVKKRLISLHLSYLKLGQEVLIHAEYKEFS